mmetsp:Transcript_32039/g.75118  ORF Transcript_32039/g.75118 Transcript_32039/m.75118 type:complete len:672 (-) Transcript_32039:55-2070(-)
MARRLTERSRVRFLGLTGKAELNGKTGRAVRFLKERGRWEVRLDSAGSAAASGSLLLKEENMQVLDPYGDALARTVLSALERCAEKRKIPSCQSIHVLGATAFELKQEFQLLLSPQSAPPSFDGTWVTEKGNLNELKDGSITWFDQAVTPYTVKDGRLTMVYAGETFTATLLEQGRKLQWCDGDFWLRKASEDAASSAPPSLEITLVGETLPASCGAQVLAPVEDWPEVNVSVRTFRGTYVDFTSLEEFCTADIVVLSNPSIAEIRGQNRNGVQLHGGFFYWAPSLHALARNSALCICTSSEPFKDGDLIAEAVYEEEVLKGCGFEILAPLKRNRFCTQSAEHPTCRWYLWASSLVFQWPQFGSHAFPPKDVDAWTWRAYYMTRRSRYPRPRYRFKPKCNLVKPPKVDELDIKHDELLEEMESEALTKKARERLMKKEDSMREEAMLVRMRWMFLTVSTAWRLGGGASPQAAALAGALAAAESFADPLRSEPPHLQQQFLTLTGAAELAAITALEADDGSHAVASLAVAVVCIFEACVVQTLYPGRHDFTPEDIGARYVQMMDRKEIDLGPGVVSMLGMRVVETFTALENEDLGSQVPLGKLIEELSLFTVGFCEFTCMCSRHDSEEYVDAVLGNLDLALASGSGREAYLFLVHKMAESAPPCAIRDERRD